MSACEPTSLGRLGTDRQLVPGDVTRVTVCRPRVDGGMVPSVVGSAAGAAAIVAALRALGIAFQRYLGRLRGVRFRLTGGDV